MNLQRHLYKQPFGTVLNGRTVSMFKTITAITLSVFISVAQTVIAQPVAHAAGPAPGDTPVPVDTQSVTFDRAPADTAFEARALIQGDADVTLSSEVAGRIIDLPYRDGDRFSKGDTLIRFDCRPHEGRLQVALASLKSAKLVLENQRRRVELDSAGALEVGLAEAAVEKATGEVTTSRFPVDRCHIRAPFDGRIVQLGAHRHETVSIGTPLMRIIDDSRLEVKIVVPSQWLSWLETGAPFEIRVDETGQSMRGKVTRMGAVIDAVSQSLPVFSTLITPDNRLISGMSGMVRFLAPPSAGGEK